MILYSLEDLTNNSIIICPVCRGTGSQMQIDTSRAIIEVSPEPCVSCAGKGRVKIYHRWIVEEDNEKTD